MRPRKKVAIYCADLDAAVRLGFVLRHRLPVEPLMCARVEDLPAIDHEVAVFILDDLTQIDRIMHACQTLPSKKLLLDHKGALGGMEVSANMQLGRRSTPADTLHAVRILLEKKRGPKPRAGKKQMSESEIAA